MTVVIGILNADEVRPTLKAEYGDYPAMFTRLLTAVDPTIQTIAYDVFTGEYPNDIDEVDAYIMTGCRYSVYEEQTWIKRLGQFVIDLDTRKKKLIGICFGHQMVAHFLGGETRKSAQGWLVGIQHCTLQQDIPGFSKTGDTLQLIAAHQDQITCLAEGTKIIASSDACPYAITTLGQHILTLQWHPEFSKQYARDLLDLRRDVFGETASKIAKEGLHQNVDNARVADWIIHFIRQQ